MQFDKLDEAEHQALEVAVVQGLAVVSHPSQPACDGGVGVAGVANDDRAIDALDHRPEHHLDVVKCDLEIVEGRVAATGNACLAAWPRNC